jgi:hypothetical protein
MEQRAVQMLDAERCVNGARRCREPNNGPVSTGDGWWSIGDLRPGGWLQSMGVLWVKRTFAWPPARKRTWSFDRSFLERS